MRVMGLDYGSKRIGLAVSDEEGKFAFPAGVIHRSNKQEDLNAILSFVEEKAIKQIVLGLPLHMDGKEGSEAKKVITFSEELRRLTRLPVAVVDERWTSIEAERALETVGGKKKARRKSGEIDASAASIILRSWLDQAVDRK